MNVPTIPRREAFATFTPPVPDSSSRLNDQPSSWTRGHVGHRYPFSQSNLSQAQHRTSTFAEYDQVAPASKPPGVRSPRHPPTRLDFRPGRMPGDASYLPPSSWWLDHRFGRAIKADEEVAVVCRSRSETTDHVAVASEDRSVGWDQFGAAVQQRAESPSGQTTCRRLPLAASAKTIETPSRSTRMGVRPAMPQPNVGQSLHGWVRKVKAPHLRAATPVAKARTSTATPATRATATTRPRAHRASLIADGIRSSLGVRTEDPLSVLTAMVVGPTSAPDLQDVCDQL